MSPNPIIINKAWVFKGGMYIFDANEIQIDPNSKEGNDIRYLFWLQDYYKELDDRQKKHFAWVTYPNDTASRQGLLISWGFAPDEPDPGPQRL